MLIALLAGACVPQQQAAESEQQSLDSALEHTARIVESIKCIVPSPQWYKDLWLDLNSAENELGRALMTHYMSCRGTTFQLSEAQFRSLPVMLVADTLGPIYVTRDFVELVMHEDSKQEGKVIHPVNETVLASTHYGNTLGHFQMHLRGHLIWKKNMLGKLVPQFQGLAKVTDNYDFNPSESQPNESWRGRDTELRVRIAHIGMPGKNFRIESEWMPFEFLFPKYDSDLIQSSKNDEKSGYSEYGEKLQGILMTELRSARWQNSSAMEKVKIVIQLLSRLHQTTVARKS